jgi:hypothetical protein
MVAIGDRAFRWVQVTFETDAGLLLRDGEWWTQLFSGDCD